MARGRIKLTYSDENGVLHEAMFYSDKYSVHSDLSSWIVSRVGVPKLVVGNENLIDIRMCSYDSD